MPVLTYVSGLGKVDNRICIVLEWTPEEASLLQDRPSELDILTIIHTVNLQLHVHLTGGLIGVSGYPRTKGQES